MYGDFIGLRVKKLREEVVNASQEELASLINDYTLRRQGGKIAKELIFNQAILSRLEQFSKVRKDKLALLVNYFYAEHRINPSWLMLESNKSHPMFITKLIIDKSLIEKQKEIKGYADKINQVINDIDIIVQNSAFK